jgi:hypothetical protein
MGVSAYRRVGVSAVSAVSACRRVGVSACRRVGGDRPEGPWELSPGLSLGCMFHEVPGLKDRATAPYRRRAKILGL